MAFRSLAAALVLLATSTAAGNTLDLRIIGSDGLPLEHAVAWFDIDDDRVSREQTAEMDHRDMQYRPHVLAVQRGTSVAFPNRDQVRHHVYSFSPAKRFEVPLYRGREADPVVFDTAGVVILGCNIHDHMVGYVVVVDTPHFGTPVASADGVIELAIPRGVEEAELVIWHPVLEQSGRPHRQTIRLGDSASLTVDLDVVDQPPPEPEGLQGQRRRGLNERFHRHRGADE